MTGNSFFFNTSLKFSPNSRWITSLWSQVKLVAEIQVLNRKFQTIELSHNCWKINQQKQINFQIHRQICAALQNSFSSKNYSKLTTASHTKKNLPIRNTENFRNPPPLPRNRMSLYNQFIRLQTSVLERLVWNGSQLPCTPHPHSWVKPLCPSICPEIVWPLAGFISSSIWPLTGAPEIEWLSLWIGQVRNPQDLLHCLLSLSWLCTPSGLLCLFVQLSYCVTIHFPLSCLPLYFWVNNQVSTTLFTHWNQWLKLNPNLTSNQWYRFI